MLSKLRVSVSAHFNEKVRNEKKKTGCVLESILLVQVVGEVSCFHEY